MKLFLLVFLPGGSQSSLGNFFLGHAPLSAVNETSLGYLCRKHSWGNTRIIHDTHDN